MKSRSNYRATRLIISALAASDLSARQLEEFAECLVTDPRTQRQIADLIMSLALRLGEHEPIEDLAARDVGVGAEIILLVKRRRMPKHEFLNTLERIAPSFSKSLPSKSLMSVDGIVRHIHDRGDHDLLVSLRDALLLESPNQDEYLKRILKRREK